MTKAKRAGGMAFPSFAWEVQSNEFMLQYCKKQREREKEEREERREGGRGEERKREKPGKEGKKGRREKGMNSS
jgi:hypothetical protein